MKSAARVWGHHRRAMDIVHRISVMEAAIPATQWPTGFGCPLPLDDRDPHSPFYRGYGGGINVFHGGFLTL